MINYRYDLRDMDYSDAAAIIFKDVGHEPEWFETSEDDLLPYETMDNIDKAYQILHNLILVNHQQLVGRLVEYYQKNTNVCLLFLLNQCQPNQLFEATLSERDDHFDRSCRYDQEDRW